MSINSWNIVYMTYSHGCRSPTKTYLAAYLNSVKLRTYAIKVGCSGSTAMRPLVTRRAPWAARSRAHDAAEFIAPLIASDATAPTPRLPEVQPGRVAIFIQGSRKLPATNATWRLRAMSGERSGDRRRHVFPHPFDDVRKGCAGSEYTLDTGLLKPFDIILGDDPTAEDRDIFRAVRPEGIDDSGEQGVMRTAHDGQTDAVDIFLDGRTGDHFGCLVEAGVDDLKAGIA